MLALLVGFDSAWTANNRGALVGAYLEDGAFHDLGVPQMVDFPEAKAAILKWQKELKLVLSLNFRTGVTPAKLFQIVTTRPAGQAPINSPNSCWLVKLSNGVAVAAAASSAVANATISFSSLIV
jgi:hypothetical protein